MSEVDQSGQHVVRPAGPDDLAAIIAIARATGQEEAAGDEYPDYISHVMARGRFVVAERDGAVTGFGAAVRLGEGPRAVCMLTDLYVDPAAHGGGAGRALLRDLFHGEPRRMTFSSLHSNALPLYTSVGMDPWWPLLYLTGDLRLLTIPDGWSVAAAAPDQVAALEREWTGADRTADHRFWAAGPSGSGVIARLGGRPLAAGTTGAAGQPGTGLAIRHLAVDSAADGRAQDSVIAVLGSLEPGSGQARVCLPGPHPAVRPLLRAGWRITGFDLHMSSEPGLLDPHGPVPSPDLA